MDIWTNGSCLYGLQWRIVALDTSLSLSGPRHQTKLILGELVHTNVAYTACFESPAPAHT